MQQQSELETEPLDGGIFKTKDLLQKEDSMRFREASRRLKSDLQKQRLKSQIVYCLLLFVFLLFFSGSAALVIVGSVCIGDKQYQDCGGFRTSIAMVVIGTLCAVCACFTCTCKIKLHR